MPRSILLVAIVTVLFPKLAILSQENDGLWKEFKKFFKKDYSAEDDLLKKPIWERALSNIFKHNMCYNNGREPFSIGINQFSDMSDKDFQKFAMGLEDKMDCNNKSMLYSPPNKASIPDSINWYERGYVTEVQNQGACGACWAFCCVAALEGQHKRMTGKLVKLSEQHLIDCSTVTGNNHCIGGQMCRAYEYAATVGGISLASEYPFTSKDECSCSSKGNECRFLKEHIGSKITGYLEIPYGDEHALLMAVALIGPVAAGLDGMRPSFRHYKSGIYDDPECNNVTLNHALTIIGYGTENGKDYWLVKNSWGPHWGENGFGKMVRNKNNQCGLASRALFPVLSTSGDGRPLLDGPQAH